MRRQRALQLLSRSKPELQRRFGVTQLALFGSTARDVATCDSDVDVLVAFDGPATSKRYFGVLFYLTRKPHYPQTSPTSLLRPAIPSVQRGFSLDFFNVALPHLQKSRLRAHAGRTGLTGLATECW